MRGMFTSPNINATEITSYLLGEGLDRKATRILSHEPRSGDAFRLHEPSMKSWGGRIRLACNWLMDNFDQATLETEVAKEIIQQRITESNVPFS